jgi:NAD(P) transhydrogenase
VSRVCVSCRTSHVTIGGNPVTLVSQAERLLPSMDGELADLMADQFAQRGVEVMLGQSVDGVARKGSRLRVSILMKK